MEDLPELRWKTLFGMWDLKFIQFSNSIEKSNTVGIRKDSDIADSEGTLKYMLLY